MVVVSAPAGRVRRLLWRWRVGAVRHDYVSRRYLFLVALASIPQTLANPFLAWLGWRADVADALLWGALQRALRREAAARRDGTVTPAPPPAG